MPNSAAATTYSKNSIHWRVSLIEKSDTRSNHHPLGFWCSVPVLIYNHFHNSCIIIIFTNKKLFAVLFCIHLHINAAANTVFTYIYIFMFMCRCSEQILSKEFKRMSVTGWLKKCRKILFFSTTLNYLWSGSLWWSYNTVSILDVMTWFQHFISTPWKEWK